MPRSAEPIDTAERLVTFIDAVVAIALTLLVLPLVDLVPDARREGLDLGDLITENLAPLGAFLLSFLVIFRFWWAHHRLFRHISGLNRTLVTLNVLWSLSIVFLPLPTAVITAYSPSSGTVLLYIGTLLVSSGALSLMAFTAYRNPELSAGRTRETREEVLGATATFVAMVGALILGTAFPQPISYWGLLLLPLTGPVEHAVKRRWAEQA